MSFHLKAKNKAELKFYEAFLRLRENKPNILPKGTKVTQNNVAKEAGVDPSALRKSRYPELIDQIQSWLESHPSEEKKQTYEKKTYLEQITQLKQRIEVITAQRDMATSKLLEAQSKILELNAKLEKYLR
nr:hypothetical protein [Moraxella osloensis]